MLQVSLPANTPHEVYRAIALLQARGYVVTRPVNEEYNPRVDSLGSYRDAYIELRDRHRAVVAELLPKLRCARGELRISTLRFAPQLGVSRSFLRQCEAGKKIPAPDLFDRWRDLLGC